MSSEQQPLDFELINKKIVEIYKKIDPKYRLEFIKMFTEPILDINLRYSISNYCRQRIMFPRKTLKNCDQSLNVVGFRCHNRECRNENYCEAGRS